MSVADELTVLPQEQSGDAEERQGGVWVASTALMILAALMLGFVAEVLLVSQVQFARSQQVLLSDFRSDLANGIAPVGGTDADGRLLEPGRPVALLSIPSLGLSDVVVVEGTTSGQTMAGPGHRRDTVLPGQPGASLLFGRQAAFGGPFGSASALQPGDGISVTTGQGVAEYVVFGVRREGDPLPPPLDQGEGRLTLVTADGTPYLPSGVVRIDARLVSPPQQAVAPPVTAAGLAPDEAAMAGDPSAWLGVLLWGQGLLLAALAVTWAKVRWGAWQAWVVGVPVLAFFALAVNTSLVQLLPNLM